MLSAILTALAPRPAYGPSGIDGASGRYQTAASLADMRAAPGTAAGGRSQDRLEAVLPENEPPLEAATRGTRWMSARSPQPDAVSFAGTIAETVRQDYPGAPEHATEASTGIPERGGDDRVPSHDDDLAGRDRSPAERHVLAAYQEFAGAAAG